MSDSQAASLGLPDVEQEDSGVDLERVDGHLLELGGRGPLDLAGPRRAGGERAGWVERIGHEDRVDRPVGDDQDALGRLDGEREVAVVVEGQRVRGAADAHLALVQRDAGVEPGGLEADLDLAVGGQVDGLLIDLDAVEVELGHSLRRGAERAEPGADLHGLALDGDARRGLGRDERDVVGLLGGQSEDERGDARLDLLDPLQALDRLRGVPGRTGQVGQDVDLVAWPIAAGDPFVGLPDRGVQGAIGRADRQAVDPLAGRRRRERDGDSRLGGIDHEDLAGVGQFLQDLERALLGLIEQVLVGPLLVAHREAGVEDQAERRGDLLGPEGGLGDEARPRQGQGHQRDQGRAGEQEQPVLDPEPLARLLLPLADQPERREDDVLGGLPHEQVQDDRQGRQGGAGRQARVQERDTHVDRLRGGPSPLE